MNKQKVDWGAVKTTDSLTEIQARMLVAAKLNLEKDGHIVPAVLIFDNSLEDPIRIAMQFNGGDEKYKAYTTMAAIGKMGKKMGILKGMIIINDAFVKADIKPESLENYKQGDLAKDPTSEECIICTLLRPDQEPVTMIMGYKREGGKFIYQEPVTLPTEGSQVTIMPNWWTGDEDEIRIFRKGENGEDEL